MAQPPHPFPIYVHTTTCQEKKKKQSPTIKQKFHQIIHPYRGPHRRRSYLTSRGPQKKTLSPPRLYLQPRGIPSLGLARRKTRETMNKARIARARDALAKRTLGRDGQIIIMKKKKKEKKKEEGEEGKKRSRGPSPTCAHGCIITRLALQRPFHRGRLSSRARVLLARPRGFIPFCSRSPASKDTLSARMRRPLRHPRRVDRISVLFFCARGGRL